jgi:hypothetical protein
MPNVCMTLGCSHVVGKEAVNAPRGASACKGTAAAIELVDLLSVQFSSHSSRPDVQVRRRTDCSAPWLAAQAPRCGEVIGRITRRLSPLAPDTLSTPLPDAYVIVIDSGSTDLARRQRAGSWARTDSAGEFRLRLPPSRTTVFEVRSIGYEPAVVAVDGSRYRAVVVDLVLGSAALHALQPHINVLTTRGVTTCAP